MFFIPIKPISFFCFFILFSSTGWAARTYKTNSWNIHLGAAVSNLVQRMNAPVGYDSKVSQIQGVLGVKKDFFFSKRVGISPDSHLWLPWRNGADGTTFTVTSHFGIPVFWEFFKVFHLSAGPGIFWESHFSKEQAIKLGNGNGTSTFYTPWRSRQVFLLSASAGLTFQFSKPIGLFVTLIVPEFANEDKRRFHALGGFSIKL